MATQGPPSSNLPPSMGPGARAIQPGQQQQQRDRESILKEVMDIRSKYTVSVDDTALNLGYELNGHARTHRLPFDTIPLGGFSRWLLYGGPGRTMVSGTFLIDAIRGAENMAGRQMNQREAEGFAYYSARRALYSFTGTAVGFSSGYMIAYYTRDKMKFPFMSPKPADRYTNFPNRYMPILKGPAARSMWHITRGNVWAAITVIASQMVFSNMGDVSMMVGLYRDERTASITQAMKGSLDRIASNRAKAAHARRQGGADSPENPSQQTASSGDEAPADHDPPQFVDDTSPAYYREADTDSQQSSTAADQGRSTTTIASSYTRPPPPPATSTPPPPPRDIFFDDDDDASPTASHARDPSLSATPAVPARSQPQGSVWARIRRGGRPDPPSSAPEEPSRDSSDSFSFSPGDADRVYARQQAQRDFDEMLERERRESGSAEYDRGMAAVERAESSGPGMQDGSGGTGGSAWDRVRGRSNR